MESTKSTIHKRHHLQQGVLTQVISRTKEFTGEVSKMGTLFTFPHYLRDATTRAEILGRTESGSEPLQLYFCNITSVQTHTFRKNQNH